MPAPSDNPWNRRLRRLLWMAGTASTLWFLSSYVMERMKEARIRAMREKRQRDLMKNHFTSLLSTISFTLYALLPTIQPQVFEAYPVEHTSQALQGLSGASSLSGSTASVVDPAPHGDTTSSSTAGPSLLLHNTDESHHAHPNEPEQPPLSSAQEPFSSPEHGRQEGSPSTATESLGTESWASEFTNQRRESQETETENETEAEMETDVESEMISSVGQIETDDGMSSIASQSISLPPTDTSSSSPSPPSDLSRSEQLHPSPPRAHAASSKSKKELWRNLKVQSLTRTLTTIYLLPMIYLLTASQLSILARQRYMGDVQSSLPAVPSSSAPSLPRTGEDDDEDDGSRTPQRASPSESRSQRKKGWFSSFSIDSMGLSEFVESSTSFLPNPVSLLPTAIASYLPSTSQPSAVGVERERESGALLALRKEEQAAQRAEAERLFLTYSWWLLHEGWKGVAKRVEESVEKIFGNMPLKKEFTLQDWEMRLKEVRAEVEMELSERSTIELYDFTPHILPTPGYLGSTPDLSVPFPRNPSDHSAYLAQLVGETVEHLSSADGRYLLEKGVSALVGNLLSDLGGSYGQTDGTRRLAECLPELGRWGKGVWEGVPDSGVEAMLGIHEFESFSALIFGDWAPRA